MAAPAYGARLLSTFSAVRIEAAVRREVRPVVQGAQRGFVRDVRRSFLQPKHGNLYRRPPPRYLHRASAPGEPPARDYGPLYKNIFPQGKDHGMSYSIRFKQPYAVELEYGVRNNGQRFPARPFVRPALAGMKPTFIRTLGNRVGYALRHH